MCAYKQEEDENVDDDDDDERTSYIRKRVRGFCGFNTRNVINGLCVKRFTKWCKI